jgi:hypothetical protein
MQRGLFSITSVKTHTTYFCNKELWAVAHEEKATHDCNDQAYSQLKMKINGKDIFCTVAFHMDKRQMTLRSTAGSSKDAPVVMRHQVYMHDEGDLVRWQGELQQPDVRFIYWFNVNAGEVYDKLAVGPRSVYNVGANSLPLKLWLSMLAIAKPHAYLVCVKHFKLTSEKYNHADSR